VAIKTHPDNFDTVYCTPDYHATECVGLPPRSADCYVHTVFQITKVEVLSFEETSGPVYPEITTEIYEMVYNPRAVRRLVLRDDKTPEEKRRA
jgi:hypothetical protein